MIIKEAIGTGITVDDAREDAVSKLGADINDDIQFDIVAFPKKKVLGIFGGGDAKVRAYIEGPDAPKKAPKNDFKRNDRKDNKKRNEAKEKPQTSVKQPVEEVVEEVPAGIPASQLDLTTPAGKAYTYLKGVLEKLDCADVDAVVSEVEGGSKITLIGSDKLGVIIGRRGETLDALQYLASLVANERTGGYYRIVIDIGNYREKRESTLESLARRTAGQVLRTGRSRSLEPMNPYERRVIHTAVQAIEGVTSASIGDGQNRRVVISPEGKPMRVSNGRNGRDRRPSRDRSQGAVKPSASTEQKPKETDGTKLYGKLK